MRNEIEILKSLDHPNIVKAYETFQRKKYICMVMELCTGCDLYARSPYTEHESALIVQKIVSAVVYLHNKSIVHRDCK